MIANYQLQPLSVFLEEHIANVSIYDWALILLFLIVIIAQLPFLLELQIKEYLWFRLKAKVHDSHWRFIPWRMPAKSLRNILILIGSSILITLSFIAFALYSSQIEFISFSIFAVAIMFLSKIYLLLVMFATQPFVEWHRNRTVKKAQSKLDGYGELKRIVITGSYGKTTVKNSVAEVLSAKFNVAKTQRNNNTVIGVAMSIMDEVNSNSEIFVCEVGAYRPREIADVTSYVKPNIGVLTAIGNQHLDLFGSKKNLIDAKMELYFDLAGGAYFYINKDMDQADWRVVSELLTHREDIHITTYSAIDTGADIYIKEIRSTRVGYDFDVEVDGNVYTFKTQLQAHHDILNLAPVIGIAMQLEFTAEEISTVIAGLDSSIGRLKIQKFDEGRKVVMYDIYNSTYHGFMGALKQLSEFDGETLVLSRGILELGKERLSSYKKIVELASDCNIKFISDDPDFARYDREGLVSILQEKDFESVVIEFMENNVEFAILFEGRFSNKFTKFIEKLPDEISF